MTNVRKYTDKQLLDRVRSLATFKGWPIGFFDVLLRSTEDGPNMFDDKFYTFYFQEGMAEPKFKMVQSGTTNPGTWGLFNFWRYNKKGCAVLADDIIVYDSHILGWHKGKYLAYIQNYDVSFPYYRDNNKNNKSETIGKIYYDRIGANCHKAGWFSVLIGKYSLGCLVRNVSKKYDAWMNLLNKQKKLTVCILKEFEPI